MTNFPRNVVLQSTQLRSFARSMLTWGFSFRGRHLKTVSLEQLISVPIPVELSIEPHAYGETPLLDLLCLCLLVRIRQPMSIFEFGTYTGRTTLNMILNAPIKARVMTLDLPPELRSGADDWSRTIKDMTIGSVYKGTPFENRIDQLYGDSRLFDISPYKGKIDFIFIDACHEYDFVLSDSKKAFEMLSDSGCVVWHDYSRACPGVAKYIRDLARKRGVFWIMGSQIVFCIVGQMPQSIENKNDL